MRAKLCSTVSGPRDRRAARDVVLVLALKACLLTALYVLILAPAPKPSAGAAATATALLGAASAGNSR